MMTSAYQAYKEVVASPTARKAADTAKTIGDQVSDFAEQVSQSAGQQFSRAQDVAVDVFGNANRALRGNPIVAASIALGLGFMLGTILARR